ncbi:MAG: alpha/beta fold hydrolase [Acidobacteriota bacterium]|nr:alpha/beta fold hydrolase [Acidobacteriota bacterium]
MAGLARGAGRTQLSLRGAEGNLLVAEITGQGPPVVLLHGLTATRHYVVMGSTSLQRAGYRVIAYDARGHGSSAPAASPAAYTYELLVADLAAVLEALGVERAVMAGASMGAHTALAFALAHPDRVLGLGLITPAFDPDAANGAASLGRWDALARGLRGGGVPGFISAYDLTALPVAWRENARRVIEQRLAAHEHPMAVADALEALPRSRPFASFADLRRVAAPAVVVASRDEADPGHPLALGERYAREIPGARLVVEDAPPPLRSPIAWQGGRLSALLIELARVAYAREAH